MGELGIWATQHHKEVGLAARALGIDLFLSCGSYSKLASEAFGVGGTHFDNQELLMQNLIEQLSPNTVVLLKGSRSSAMDKIVNKLLN